MEPKAKACFLSVSLSLSLSLPLHPEVTLCHWQDVKIQVLLLSVSLSLSLFFLYYHALSQHLKNLLVVGCAEHAHVRRRQSCMQECMCMCARMCTWTCVCQCMHHYKGPLTICCDGLLVWKQHALKLLKVDSANNSIQVPGEKKIYLKKTVQHDPCCISY